MRRRSTPSGGQPAKSRRRKAAQLRRNARKAKQAPGRSASSAETKITQLTRERDEALRIAGHWGAVPQEIGAGFPCTRGSVAGRTVIDRKPVHVIHLQAAAEEFPEGRLCPAAGPSDDSWRSTAARGSCDRNTPDSTHRS